MHNAYLRFCIYFGLRPVPASSQKVVAYTAFLARSLKPTSISAYLNYIRLLHLDNGFVNPLLNNFLLDSVKKGIKREKGLPSNQKLPITPSVLLDIYRQLDMKCNFDIAFWAACLVAFYSFLRKATLLPRNIKDLQKALSINDLTFKDDIAVLTVRQTKTIQFGQWILTIPLCSQKDSVLDPVKALLVMLKGVPPQHRDKDMQTPLFSFVDVMGNMSCLCYDTFVKCLKSSLSHAGYPADQFSGHSFRRGGCTFAFQIGIPASLIKLRGDWHSNCYEQYITVSQDLNLKVGKALVVATSSV